MEFCTCGCHSSGGIHFAACCTSCEDCGAKRVPMDQYSYHKQKCQFRSILGMSADDARKFVESVKYDDNTNYVMRVIKEDDKSYAVTCDFRFDRLNVEIKEGKISFIDGIS